MGHILKADRVQLADALQLSLDPAASPVTADPMRACQPSSEPAHIRIAENHPEYALVEVTCSCGKTTLVRCDYAPAPA